MRSIVTRFVLLGCFLLSAATVAAREQKTPSVRNTIVGIAASAHDVKPLEFKAPELKPLTEKLPAAFTKASPDSVADLKAIQEHVANVVDKVMPAVVCVRAGASFGSGIIVSRDGYILTAGHVSGQPGRDVTVYFHNGKPAKGKTLGGNHGIDSGMIKITTAGDWPFVEMGDSAALGKGDWCMVIAHPGGFKSGRTPPVRLGRLLNADARTLTTDCILVGGDSGGPLLDMHGRVIGINSRIGQALTTNMHVPVNPFRDNWDKIAKSEVWGGKLGGPVAKSGPFLGVQTDFQREACVILAVTPGSPAEKAGLKANDVIRKFDDREITTPAALTEAIQMKKIGAQIVLEIVRGEETLSLTVELGQR
jgi:serine protease Do